MVKRKKSLSIPQLPISFGFTLVEILIVISIIAILATILFAGNIQSSFQKTRDSKRKQDLNKLIRVLENYLSDKGDYPPANDPPNGEIGNAVWGAAFNPYVPELPRDPLWPNRNYYYQVNISGVFKFYIIYAKLEYTGDADIVRLDCQNGCGPANPQGQRLFNYYVSSPNLVLADGIPPGYDPGIITTPTVMITPTPTFNPYPPAGPDACAHNQCCSYHDCGAIIKPPGVYCGPAAKCWYENSVPPFGWECMDAFTPPESC